MQVPVALQRGEHEHVRYGITNSVGESTDFRGEQFRRHGPGYGQHPDHGSEHVKQQAHQWYLLTYVMVLRVRDTNRT